MCLVPQLVGKEFAGIEKLLTDAGCTLGKVTETNGTPPGRVVDQGAPPDTTLPIGTPVDVGANGPLAGAGIEAASAGPGNPQVAQGSPADVSLGAQVLGEAAVKSQAQEAAGPAPILVRTGGVAFAGLALWLLISGLGAQLAGSNRLWRLLRSHKR